MAPSPEALTGQGYSRWVAKAPRMRAACTQCHAAKIRCSGDKTGCQRCTSLGIHCEYVISMVGRTPKRQRKTSEARSANGTQVSPRERQSSEASSLARSSYPSSTRSSNTETTSLIPTTNSQPDNFDVSSGTIFVSGADNPTLPSTDFTDEQLFDCLNDDNWMSGGTSCPTSLDDGSNFAEAPGFEIEGFSMPTDFQPMTATSGPPSFLASMVPQPPPPASLPVAAPSFFPMSPRSPGQNSGAGGGAGIPNGGSQDWTQYAHIVALCKMIRLLENHVQTKSMAVDEVMRLSQACIRDISRISAKREYMQCKSCPALISTIMELIVTLYEDTTSTANADHSAGAQQQQHQQVQEPQTSAPTLSTKLNGPFLQFGVFELDPEEQAAIRNRIIRKQAQECVQIIQMLKRLLGPECEGSGSASPDRTQSQALGNWYKGMEKRMNLLISSLMPDY